MIETYILLVIIIVLISIIVILVWAAISFVKRYEVLERIVIDYETREEDTREALDFMLKTMREIDIRGSFESDDEVGSVFNELKRIIEVYNNR
jgi:hypothetical protein